MKKLLLTIFTLLFSLTLFACDPTEEINLDDYLDDVVVGYRGSDTEDAVTESLDLMTEIEDVTITWESSHPNIINATGVVVRPEVDTEVTLTATLTLGNQEDEVSFTVLVKAAIIPIHPLEEALNNMNGLLSYTMNITFTSDETSYPVIVKMGETTASVEALGDTIYYEVDGETCYIYENINDVWTKSITTCSEKGTSELSFLTNFSKNYFAEQTSNGITTYLLKMEYYTSLQSFLNSSIVSNFVLTIESGYVRTIDMIMTRDSITFDVEIVISAYNQTTVTLPVIPS
ncbi:MAG: hypothetical protein A2Y45_08050 [Tenericutes bacterium GWC2_34_14]|nr:MAG: hypothetical protein A2Z84_07045 [Tenericutes bacterium GWA2_35_7]OHE29849.1 MAG: hypothetical protein A2Y45_08050 [Tenericutes bacterium GWC2_34_14]OHE34828.1 MAG: hypothetical protein A2012_01660 [Tenericutes bacterium GWE2_34_108]OHE37311.1 MAG: hypothetical protein A2Y46_01350 [Tenericutes bacterium GWF1_35_14]OHE39556.1 MAG: hypothetical protein A2Y44_01510 [Tenericutes bacterium GWF2_35_184]OHE43176.1 MAG: hypothetical protein A3K26_03095 [Tenericutes bacterium RIFOXYA12_FULL_35_